MSRTTNKSIFASAIKALLDETNLFNRREWAEFLRVSESAISQWVQDKTIPRPDLLFMIVDVLEQSSDIPDAPLESFRTMARQEATEVSPYGKRMLPTVWAYMTRPAFSELSNTLARLSPEEQAKLLFEKHKRGELADEAVDEVLDTDQTVVPSGQVAKVASRVPQVPSRPVEIIPVITCARAETPVSCAEWEPTSWKGMMMPRFRLLGAAGERGIEGQTHDWDDISRHRHVLIVAKPGTGKTSFLLHLARADWVQGEGMGVLRFYFHLGCLSRVQTADDFEGICRKLLPPDAHLGRTMLFLDGFDEVRPENRKRLAGVISGFQSRNPETTLVVSSRPSPDLVAFANMTQCEMDPPPADHLIAWVQQELSEKLAGGIRWGGAMQTFVSSLRERPDVFRELQNPLLLSHCTHLFVRHSLTANHDVDMFQECLRLLLDDWDEKKNIVRAANVWARPRHLYQWLSGLCFHTLTEQRREFTSDEVESWCRKYSTDASVEEILRVLSEATGIIRPSGDKRWSIVHATFQEYLAARYIVDSSSDATSLIRERLEAPWMSNVLKFACAATNDASHLLRFALTADWLRPDHRMATLADMLAQQLTADTDLIKRSCHELTDWLDSSFAGWETTTVDEGDEGDQISSPKWRLVARKTRRNDAPESGSLLRTLRAIHRTRMSPAKSELSERLRASRSDIVRTVGESLDVDGYLQARMFPQNGNAVLVAEVLAA